MKKRLQKEYVLPIASLLVVLFLMLFNIINNKQFFIASFFNCTTLFIAIFISFLLSQKKSDERKRKEVLLDLLKTIQHNVDAPQFFIVTEESDIKSLLMAKRDLSNKIHILEVYATEFNIKDDTDFIITKFKEYEDFISEHSSDIEHMKKSANDLKRPLSLIGDKTFDAMLRLYK